MNIGESFSQEALTPFALGFLSAYVFLKYRAHISERGAQISDHIKDIEKLSVAAVELWASDEDKYQLATEVQLHHTLSVQFFEDIRFACHKRRLEYERLMFDLFRVTASDEFIDQNACISEKKTPNSERVQEIIDVSSSLITLLRKVRADISSLEYLAWDTWRWLSLVGNFIKKDLLNP